MVASIFFSMPSVSVTQNFLCSSFSDRSCTRKQHKRQNQLPRTFCVGNKNKSKPSMGLRDGAAMHLGLQEQGQGASGLGVKSLALDPDRLGWDLGVGL